MRPFAIVLVSIVALLSAGCSNHPAAPELGTMGLQMTDAPGDFDAVHLVVEQVAAHREGADASGWEVLNATPGTYDLLSLQNGVFARLGIAAVPAGHYTQLRLMLGAGSNVVVGGVTYPLGIPSGLQSGLKLTGDFDVPAGGGLELGLDFDAAQSIAQGPTGAWTLSPTVRLVPLAAAGAISGQVWPPGVTAQVVATRAGTVVATTELNANGGFQLSLLPAGSYDVTVTPNIDYAPVTLTGVVVSAGATTDLGVVELNPGM